MKLADWLYENSMTPEQLRRMLGVSTRTTFRRYLTGERIPHLGTLAKIEHITAGRVTKADFQDSSPPRCASVLELEDGSVSLVFPWSSEERRRAVAPPDPGYRPEWKHPTEALQTAFDLLPGRVRMTKRGRFLLDGRPSDARRIVHAANTVLIARGDDPIEYPTVRRKDG